MTKEIQEIKPQEVQVISSSEIISSAIAKGADLEQVEKLLELKMKYEADEARKAYYVAMASFKANPIHIHKDKSVGYSAKGSTVGYSHASLANIVTKIGVGLSEHGLSASWSTKQNGTIEVTCKITHKMGHSESTSLSAPSDTSGSKNPIQAIGSTITYLERYTLLAITGQATHDQDDDGAGAAECITDKQLSELRDCLIALGTKEEAFAKAFQINSLELLSKDKFQGAKKILEAKLTEKGIK